MKKRSVTLKGHPTSITLEDEFWTILKSIAKKKNQSIAGLINDIDEKRIERQSVHGLSSAIRIYVLNWVLEPDRIPLP
jgi:predicted DNA-binding ribbon-helix-helix protein